MRITALRRRSNLIIPATATVALLGLTGCTSGDSAAQDAEAERLVLVTHDSFALSEGTLEAFTDETGIEVEVQAAGDAGELVNKLVLTKESPLGDVVFGVDNTFASRAASEGVFEAHVAEAAADSDLLLPAGSGGDSLTPIDFGDVCVNVDREWFAAEGVAEPTTLDDLTDPAYADLLVVEAANSSSPGLAFLLATIDAYGEDGWQQYWRDLLDNGTRVSASWSDAYYVDFSGPSSEGDRPLVVSYASSPPYEVAEGETEAPTAALLDTCYRQVEYAGVLAGTEHSAEAAELVDFLYSVDVQEDIPENMYVFPANPAAELPATWAQFAAVADDPYALDPAEVDANRENWIREWAEIASS